MGQAKQRQEKLERLVETTRGRARMLEPVRPLEARMLMLVGLTNSRRRERYDILDYDALQKTADAVATHLHERFADERFCVVAFPALYPLFGLYDDAYERILAFEARALQAVLAAGVELNTQACCMERAVLTQIDQKTPQPQVSDTEFDAAALCYLPFAVVGELPLSEGLRGTLGAVTTGADLALSQLAESQDLEVGCMGLVQGDQASLVYEIFAAEALTTRIALGREEPPRFHLIVDQVLLSAGNDVWLGHPRFANMAEAAEDEIEATEWLIEHQRFTGQLRRKLTEHGLVVRAAFFEREGDEELAAQMSQALRHGTLESGEDFLIELVKGEPGEFPGAELLQLTQYFDDEQFVLGVLSASRGTDIAFQQNLYPCSDKALEAIVAYTEQVARDAGMPLQRTMHDGVVLVCPHCFEPVPLVSDGDEDEAQPLRHSLH